MVSCSARSTALRELRADKMKAARRGKIRPGRVEKHCRGWRARRYHCGHECRGPVRYSVGAALADLPMLHVDDVRAEMYRQAKVAKPLIGTVDAHGPGYRARVSWMKGRTRATEAEALEDLVALRILHGSYE